MRKDLIEKAEADAKRAAQGDALPLGQADGQPKAEGRRLGDVGQSGVPDVVWSQGHAEPARAKPWRVKQGRSGHVARVATVAEGAAVAEAAVYVGGLLGHRSDGKAMRKTIKRMAADLIDGQAVLPLGDGLEGWLPEVSPSQKSG